MNVEESKQRLSSLVEQQLDLKNKLHVSTLEISECETKLENVMAARTEMLMVIEELSRQRDVLNKRVMFFKEKDDNNEISNINEKSFYLREYTKEEIMLATNNFSEYFRLKSCGDWSNVYRGNINHSNVAIKMLGSTFALSQQDFQAKVNIRHPHLVAVLGFCSEPKCLVLEYMQNGNLEDKLLCKTISWQDCIRIAIEVCSGLGFLNSFQPRPIIHCHISPSNILLDNNLVAKVTFCFHGCNEECNVGLVVKEIGILLLHILTGRGNWGTIDMEAFYDEIGEEWPFDVARELLDLAMRCMSNVEEMSIRKIMEELNEIKRKGCDSIKVPNIFLCPIQKRVMRNPYIAADGFSYELEAIEEWLQSGNDISPKSLRLKNTLLLPNHNLRSLIQYWHSKRSANQVVK
ncbi:U-box domain-containing protein 50-like [Trifolium pratense]|uniref:RING-type E3 ubiquitin transferase n=1 Tax=Trifolium pratense TaxID=57577 RepID=A0A2K3NYE7_TRIPR|nr:U-box domain-containing protein 50-like [Trifolium pratense]